MYIYIPFYISIHVYRHVHRVLEAPGGTGVLQAPLRSVSIIFEFSIFLNFESGSQFSIDFFLNFQTGVLQAPLRSVSIIPINMYVYIYIYI